MSVLRILDLQENFLKAMYIDEKFNLVELIELNLEMNPLPSKFYEAILLKINDMPRLKSLTAGMDAESTKKYRVCFLRGYLV